MEHGSKILWKNTETNRKGTQNLLRKNLRSSLKLNLAKNVDADEDSDDDLRRVFLDLT